ncbi:hypothetical protein CDD82_5721 [Ophiocordyceps australis]|uniref:Uncharacterized protein n=1 Tax=Ophiocordyceps australis TaxID=1399860 RepID=A0A2C5XHV6_9HYPO|nr:hypothetical protein CDD82_5721 [Ophiocordyceps australis]
MPSQSVSWSRRDSWPPTQVRLAPTLAKFRSNRPLLDNIDDNPLTYFLTPTREHDVDAAQDEDMDFDAGIEDANHPPKIVRSVSPSSLGSLNRHFKSPCASPDLESDGAATDDDDDDDEYIRFSPSSPSSLSSLRNMAIDGIRLRTLSPVFGHRPRRPSMMASYPAPQLRGPTDARVQRVQTRSLSSSPRPGRLWREPSLDVWSIAEETEQDMLDEECSTPVKDEASRSKAMVPTKPKKRVRFSLPATE